jgi:hypothetical protein
VAGKDITEDIPLNIGNPSTSGIWNNTAENYDVAIGGLPFILAPSDINPYGRGTAPYRKDQFDSSKEPGEQSLTGWWIRSQSSFHGGAGIKFYDPSAGETIPYRYLDSQGINVWTKGQATLLKDVTENHITTGYLDANSIAKQHLRSIKWTTSGVTYQGVLLHDEYDVDKIDSAGALTNYIDYNAGSAEPVYAICDDGVNAYWVVNHVGGGANKLHMFKKPLSGDSTTGETLPSVTGDVTKMFDKTGLVITSAVMEFVKDRIVLCVNNAVYEIEPNASALPTAVYTNPNTNYVYTSIAASGPAIYTSGLSGLYSTIQKYTLVEATGAMPVLSSASVAAEFPAGEIVYKLFYYLGYMIIGTNRGVRVAQINDQDGSITYGPLIAENNTQAVYDFAARDHFVWCATGVANLYSGLTRIDLSATIEGEPLRFAYANDLQQVHDVNYVTTAVSFIGNTNRIAYSIASVTMGTNVTNKARTTTVATLTTQTAHGLVVGDKVWIEGVGSPFDSTTAEFTVTAIPTTTTFTYTTASSGTVASTAVTSAAAKANKVGHIYLEHATNLVSSGYIQTGAIRYGTLEPKNFKLIRGRGVFTNGAMDIQSIEESGDLYNVISYDANSGNPEAATIQPEGPQEFVSYKFTLSRSASNNALGPTFKGYQIKALPATKRQRLIQFPVWCFDVESDRYNIIAGYEGRAWERIQLLEELEANGDIINVQDFTTGERVQGLIEQMTFSRKTPPSDRYSGFGGLLIITIRTVF